jgi:hypothetical protein
VGLGDHVDCRQAVLHGGKPIKERWGIFDLGQRSYLACKKILDALHSLRCVSTVVFSDDSICYLSLRRSWP